MMHWQTRTLWGSQAPSRACHSDTPSARICTAAAPQGFLGHSSLQQGQQRTEGVHTSFYVELPTAPPTRPWQHHTKPPHTGRQEAQVQGMSQLAVAPSKPAGQHLSPVQPEAGRACCCQLCGDTEGGSASPAVRKSGALGLPRPPQLRAVPRIPTHQVPAQSSLFCPRPPCPI